MLVHIDSFHYRWTRAAALRGNARSLDVILAWLAMERHAVPKRIPHSAQVHEHRVLCSHWRGSGLCILKVSKDWVHLIVAGVLYHLWGQLSTSLGSSGWAEAAAALSSKARNVLLRLRVSWSIGLWVETLFKESFGPWALLCISV